MSGADRGETEAGGTERLFEMRRTPKEFEDRALPEHVEERLYDILKWGPTCGNIQPARFVFLKSRAAREKLRDAVSPANLKGLMSAPLLVLVCTDPLFFEKLPRIGSMPDLRSWFAADVGLSEEMAFRNSSMEGAYLILAARALGLDVLPVSGFDEQMVETAFLSQEGWRINFIAGIGYGKKLTLPSGDPLPRLPRIDFEEACLIL